MLILIVGIVLSGLIACHSPTNQELNIYSWADNIDPEVIAEFEKKYQVKVNYEIYSSNEELLRKLKKGSSRYDLIQPSDYMVSTMVKLKLLEKLDKEKIPNLKNIARKFQSLPYDPESTHSIIYTWGVTGIAYNTKYIKGNIDSWQDLWRTRYKGRVVLLHDQREVVGMSLIKNGFSNSTTNAAELQKAVSDLRNLKPNLLAFDTDTIKQKLMAEEAWIGTVWSGDAFLINQENTDIAYVIPKEGATIWADTLAIPKGAKNKELAEKFINYLLEPAISAKNYESIGYSNPNEQAYPLHSEDYRSNKIIFNWKIFLFYIIIIDVNVGWK